MKERPIIFNAEMVRAILDGRKTQTRRFVPEWQLPSETKQDAGDYPENRWMAVAQRDRRWGFGVFGATEESCAAQLTESLCPFGSRDDRLWVRECHAFVPEPAYRRSTGIVQIVNPDDDYQASVYRENFDRSDGGIKWRPSIHMPRWASRIQLEITNARVERLNVISEEDARAEGVAWSDGAPNEVGLPTQLVVEAKDEFARLWQSIYGEESWNNNPWVWVIEFNRVEGGAA